MDNADDAVRMEASGFPLNLMPPIWAAGVGFARAIGHQLTLEKRVTPIFGLKHSGLLPPPYGEQGGGVSGRTTRLSHEWMPWGSLWAGKLDPSVIRESRPQGALRLPSTPQGASQEGLST